MKAKPRPGYSGLFWYCVRCEVDEEEEKKKETKKTRKRVRFNLNVQTYEPILPTRYENCCIDDDDDDEDGEGEISKGSSVIDKKPEDLSLSSGSEYPSNYRYQNCVDSFEDEEGYGESDLEDEDYYTDDEDDDDEEEDEVYGDKDVTPLLNPVENIAQWKAVKAKPVRVKQLMMMKENVEDDQTKPLLMKEEIIVNTSLSNWLASSPKSFHSSKRSPILDITNQQL